MVRKMKLAKVEYQTYQEKREEQQCETEKGFRYTLVITFKRKKWKGEGNLFTYVSGL